MIIKNNVTNINIYQLIIDENFNPTEIFTNNSFE